MDYIKVNQNAWDEKVADENIWTQAVTSEEVKKAMVGDWNIVVTPKKNVPRNWFPEDLKGKEVLCLASGGGQQGPIMAAVGANVVVFDNSPKQLHQDMMVAKRDGLIIKTVQGNMKDLSMFADESFDIIIHPWSNSFVDTVIPVWREAYRVLKFNGILISGFANPIEYIFDLVELNQGRFKVRHKIPYSDLTSLSEVEFEEITKEGICFGHTLEDQIGGQIEAGFVIGGFYEDIGGTALDQYIYSSIATRALKI